MYKSAEAGTVIMEISAWPSAKHNNTRNSHWRFLRYDAKWNTLNTIFQILREQFCTDIFPSELHEIQSKVAKNISDLHFFFFCSGTSGSKLKSWSNVSDTWIHDKILLLAQYWPRPQCTQLTAWDNLHDGMFACVLVKLLKKGYEQWCLR